MPYGLAVAWAWAQLVWCCAEAWQDHWWRARGQTGKPEDPHAKAMTTSSLHTEVALN
jgi:hypothetical protein